MNSGAQSLSFERFLLEKEKFKLGDLVTESSHPKTEHLSRLVKSNLTEAIKTFSSVDLEIFSTLEEKYDSFKKVHRLINETLSKGKRVYLSGCGATGRLSLVLENIWRRETPAPYRPDQVIGFMAGGDLALIHSIEKFEDFPEYGMKQLDELGFGSGDLLLASTEGGETPWVIGTAHQAIARGGKAVFLYCNPDEILKKTVKRSREVIEDERIIKVNLTTGPQALSGSTRLQASSILTVFIGLSLFGQNYHYSDLLHHIKENYNKLDLTKLLSFIMQEFNAYRGNSYIYYGADQDLAISVLTDTTERSPTFSLLPFDNINDPNSAPSLSYLFLNESQSLDSIESWKMLLKREPRTLEWDEVKAQAGRDRLLGFNISKDICELRKEKVSSCENFLINLLEDGFKWHFGGVKESFRWDQFENRSMNLLIKHFYLKLLLNMHSTLLMGKMGRYEGNLMTFVRPSNMKLIDRTIRYADILLRKKGIGINYNELARRCFELRSILKSDQPIVLEIVQSYIDL